MSATARIHPTKAGHTLTSERLDVPDWGSGGGGRREEGEQGVRLVGEREGKRIGERIHSPWG